MKLNVIENEIYLPEIPSEIPSICKSARVFGTNSCLGRFTASSLLLVTMKNLKLYVE